MEFLKSIGIAGFMFFLIKGILWLVLFALIYFGVIKEERIKQIKSKINIFKRKPESK
ncbi:MAG: hypothetical protein JNK61_01455 [Bacteroidia bacterium]|nr:hypothetical protein [Bacteroidia bacterium]